MITWTSPSGHRWSVPSPALDPPRWDSDADDWPLDIDSWRRREAQPRRVDPWRRAV
ncbi:hypothetical protein ACQPX6_06150 [Actinomycetospora sp. CA-101289]|uniref:hypothetical protein n=1 Tax=Actinomycetospora sp. CA-101289 TaxID=3239893 RepID=UPI003D98D4D9